MNLRNVFFFACLPLIAAESFGEALPPAITQVSTIDALLASAYDGAITVAELTRYGDLGIGTPDHIDGELIVLDGEAYSARGDGSVVRLGPDATVAFGSVAATCGSSLGTGNGETTERNDCASTLTATNTGAIVAADRETTVRNGRACTVNTADFNAFTAKLDAIIGTPNVPVAIRFHGRFTRMCVRSEMRQEKPYRPLAEVMKTCERRFDYADVEGDLVGFRLPPFVKGLNVPGWHLHFISADRTRGGHVRDFASERLHGFVYSYRRFQTLLPDAHHGFHSADHSVDRSSDLAVVEGRPAAAEGKHSVDDGSSGVPWHNPLFPGYYADPQIRHFGDRYWIFPTGCSVGKGFDAFSSSDLKMWTCHPGILKIENVSWARTCMWAPDAHEKDGKYYLFFSANDAYPVDLKGGDLTPQKETGQQKYGGIGVAVADRPHGPYRDLVGRPLIDQFWNRAQPIDQYVFRYKDGWYMVYGGWNHCNIVRLAPDFKSLLPLDDGKLYREITPPHYKEGSVMFERKGVWYFMYSGGNWTDDTYCVRYCTAPTPFGPFTYKDKVLGSQIPLAWGPGHHSVLNIPGTDDWYICYHRRPYPDKVAGHRVTCLDRLCFTDQGDIKPVVMTK